ncbi:anion exchange protein [Sarcoptes scabiei]|nr:anion exchange protein [Sarcoptes scabiei]
MQLLSNFDTSSFAKSIIGDDPRLQPFLSDSIASASNSSLNGQSIANMPSMMIPLSDSPYALSPMLYSQTLLPKAQHYMNYGMGKNPIQHQDQSSLLHSSKSFGNHANHKSRPFNGQSGDGITSNSQMSEHNYGGHPPNKPKQTVGQAIPTNYLLKNTKMFDQQDQFSDQFAYGNHQASTSDDEAKDKMSYYKKLLSSFDDFDKDRSTSSFNELLAKEPIDFNHFNQNGQNGLNFDMNSFNNDEQSFGTKFDQHRSKSSLDYYHQLNFDKESFNDQNFGKGGSDGNDGNDSLQMMMQKPETTRDHGRPTAPFSGIDEEKFMTAASMINPTAIHVLNSSVHKNQYERNRLNENSDQINDMRGFSSSPQISSQPSFLPFVNFEALPSVHFKTNHPRPVASRFKEFFKNMINQKF